MQILNVAGAGKDFSYQWPESIEDFHHWIDYLVREGHKEFVVRIAFGIRHVYQKHRARVIVWIDGNPEVEFFGIDDNAITGNIITEIKIERNKMCRYPDDPVPLDYGNFDVVGLPTVVAASGVRNAWGVLVNIADHKTILHMAFLRKLQRGR
jgi:hypothetical protein